MADRSQAQHRKKKRVRLGDNSPFPVPIGTISAETSNKSYWFYFTGDLKGNHVKVSHSGDIALLYKMGFFGRGLLSRGTPSLYRSLPTIHVPVADDQEPERLKVSQEPERLKVMRRRMYLRHRHWSQQSRPVRADGQMEADDNSTATDYAEFDSDVEYPPEKYHYDAMNTVMESAESNPIHKSCDQTESSDWFSQTSHDHSGTNHNESTEQTQLFSSEMDALQRKGRDGVGDTTWRETDTDFWTTNNDVASSSTVNISSETSWNVGRERIVANEDAWDTMEADADFWGVDASKQTDNASTDKAGKDIMQEAVDSKNDMQDKTTSQGKNTSHPRVRKKSSEVNMNSPSKRLKLASDNSTTDVAVMRGDNDCDNKPKPDTDTNIVHGSHSNRAVVDQPIPDTDTDIVVHCSHSNNAVDDEFSSANRNSHVINYSCAVSSVDTEKPEGLNKEVSSVGTMSCEKCVNCDKSSSCRFENSSQNESICQEEYDPCCREEDEDGDYLVIDDSDCDDRVVGAQRKLGLPWKPVRKKEMCPVEEPLVLSSEEAFFLSYGLGCLTVRDETRSPCTLTELWNRFSATPRFLPCYVAYHYFRSKGWVPKTGVVFGVDFIVYKVGPAFYHSSYSVIVKAVEEGSFTELDEYMDRKLTWRALAGLNRVTEHVAKTLMFCYVIVPKDLTADDKLSPKCLSRFTVKLQIINRWISAQERDKDKETDVL